MDCLIDSLRRHSRRGMLKSSAAFSLASRSQGGLRFLGCVIKAQR